LEKQKGAVPNNSPNVGFTYTVGSVENTRPVSQNMKEINALSPKIKFLKYNSLHEILYQILV